MALRRNYTIGYTEFVWNFFRDFNQQQDRAKLLAGRTSHLGYESLHCRQEPYQYCTLGHIFTVDPRYLAQMRRDLNPRWFCTDPRFPAALDWFITAFPEVYLQKPKQTQNPEVPS